MAKNWTEALVDRAPAFIVAAGLPAEHLARFREFLREAIERGEDFETFRRRAEAIVEQAKR
ncbi:MAG TPA: hypothetical protein VIG36_11340 [Methylocystis sp.]|jgi:hypothetical protein